MNYDKLKKILEEKQSFVLVCHVDPDGDAIGALTALAALLESQNKKVFRVCKDPVPEVFSFMNGSDLIKNEWPQSFEVVILVDNGDVRRTGFSDQISVAKSARISIVNIDHHPKNDLWRLASVNLTNDSASSTCELIYDLANSFNLPIDSAVATSLLAGIFYDTGSFQHQNTSQKVLNITAELLRKGAKLKVITKKMVNDRSTALFKLWGIALNRLTLNEKYGIAFSVLTQADLAATNTAEEEIFGLVNLLSTNASAKATLLLYESKDGKIKGSLRTESNDVNMSKLAALFGGGGHRKAAGFVLEGKIERAGDIWKIA